MSEAPRDRSSVLARIALVKKNVAQARDESIAARTPVAPSPASSVPATPRSEASADFVNFVDPRSMRRHQRHSNLPESLQQRHHFIDTWASKIEAFVWDNTRMVMELPTDLQGADRKALHQLANEYNLSHHSSTVNGLRRLVLKKDDLFFAKNLHKPDDEQIRKLKEERGIRHNRREEEEVVPEKKKYADQSAYKAFKTFHKATDAYAKAVETGYQIEDEAAFVAPPAQPANAHHTGAGISEQSVGWSAALSSNEDVHNSAAMATLKDAADRGDLFEVCTVCGARQQVDYDPSRWECIGPCEACQTDRIWRLETKAGAVMEAPSTSKPQDANRTKRERPVEASVDEETRPPALSVEEVVQLAELHNMPAPVVKWIRAFAESRERNGATDDHVLFCMDFSDFDRYLPRPQADSRLYFYRVLHHEATKCINKILMALDQRGRPEPVPADDQAPANRSTAIQDVYVGFPGMDIDLEGGSPMRLLVGVFTHGSLDETTARLAANDVNTGLNVTHAVKCGLTVSEALSE